MPHNISNDANFVIPGPSMEVDAERLSIDEVYPPASTPIAFTPPSEFGAKSSSEQNSQTQFLVRWKGIIQPKFVPLLSALSQKVAARSLLLSQVRPTSPELWRSRILRGERNILGVLCLIHHLRSHPVDDLSKLVSVL